MFDVQVKLYLDNSAEGYALVIRPDIDRSTGASVSKSATILSPGQLWMCKFERAR